MTKYNLILWSYQSTFVVDHIKELLLVACFGISDAHFQVQYNQTVVLSVAILKNPGGWWLYDVQSNTRRLLSTVQCCPNDEDDVVFKVA